MAECEKYNKLNSTQKMFKQNVLHEWSPIECLISISCFRCVAFHRSSNTAIPQPPMSLSRYGIYADGYSWGILIYTECLAKEIMPS